MAKSHRKILFFLTWLLVGQAISAQPIDGLLKRILPEDFHRFSYQKTTSENHQATFTIACDGSKIDISGTDNVAIAAGINWFLQHHAGINISWNNPGDQLPEKLPVVAPETHTASVDFRYYLNFCTHSYSMAFWDWNRWQQEIDWMALHGINLPLIITGMESVWKEVLMGGYGYENLAQVNGFVTGPAYFGWFFMNNMTAWGGPLPESWYEQRAELGRKIFQRLRDFDMKAVIPGFVGMVPKNFLQHAAAEKVAHWKPSDIVDGGVWCDFQRPFFIDNTDRLKEFAEKYYAAIEKVFGEAATTHFYAIDPFHEGRVPKGVSDAKASVQAMYEALLQHDSEAVWVAQHWQENPTTIVTHTVPKNKLIILDLHGDSSGDIVCSGHHTDEIGQNHDWIWGQVSNFGGNVGLFGRVNRLINCFYAARDNASENALVGIGALPEGIENNAMIYDLLYALPWTNIDYTPQTWIRDYVRMRYGMKSQCEEVLTSVWTRLLNGIYNCPNDRQQGTTESVFLMRPSLKAGTVSSWANSSWYWDFDEVRKAVGEMLSVAETMKNNENFRYDLTDLMRQALADYGKTILDSISNLSEVDEMGVFRRKKAVFNKKKSLENRFLELILDQDRLLGTRREFRLGRWTEMARNWSENEAEKALYERNARMLLTTWGDRAQCETGGLHDYANREWNGLLSSYYYPRWKAFFGEKRGRKFEEGGARKEKRGRKFEERGTRSEKRGTRKDLNINWFRDFEWPFVNADSEAVANYLPKNAPYASFSAEPEGDCVSIAKELYDKYFNPENYVQSCQHP